MKKIFLSLCLIGSAETYATTSLPFDGLYAGGSLGESFAQTNLQFSGSADAELTGFATTRVPLGTQSNIVKNSLIGAAFLGYGRTWKSFYMGGELALFAANYKMNSMFDTGLSQEFNFLGTASFTVGADATITTEAKMSPIQFAAILRPGYLLAQNTLLYGRVGVAVAKVSYSATTAAASSVGVTSPDLTTTLVFPVSLYAANSAQRALLQLGGGLEQKFNDRLSVRVDYTCTNYGRLQAIATNYRDLTAFDGSGDIVGNLTVSGNNFVKMIDQTVMLGLIYHFNV